MATIEKIEQALPAGTNVIGGVKLYAADGTTLIGTQGAHGGLPIEGVAGGTAVPVSGTVTASAGTGAAHHAAGVITIAAGVGSLAARATRVSVTFWAPKANVADVVMESSGAHIAPGASVTVPAVDLFSFTGTNNDTLQYVEVYN